MKGERFWQNKKMRTALIIQAALLVVLALLSLLSPKSSVEIAPSQLTANSGYTSEDGARVLDDSFGYLGEFTKTPTLTLPRGSYRITMSGERSTAGNLLTVECTEGQKETWFDVNSVLPAGVEPVSTTVWVWGSSATVAIGTYYQAGRVVVESFEASSCPSMAVFLILAASMLFTVTDVLVWQLTKGALSARYPRKRIVFITLALAVLLSSLPLFFDGIYEGFDLRFHLMRIEGIKEGWLGGQFPVRVNPFALFDYGYGDSLMYPNLLLWPFALLRLCGVPIIHTFKFLVFCFNALTAFCAYISLKTIFKNDYAACFGAAAYTLALYRAINLYLRSALAEGLAMSFFPLILAGLYLLIFEPLDSKTFGKGVCYVLAGYTGVIQTHLISTLFAAIMTALICLVCLRRVFEKKRFTKLATAAGLVLALNLWFIIPLLDAMKLDYFMDETQFRIAPNAALIEQLFNPLARCVGGNQGLSEGIEGEMPLSVGLVLLVVVLSMLFVFIKRGSMRDRRAKIGVAALSFSALSLLVCSIYFPWDILYDLAPGVVSPIQFPWRFLSLASLWLSVAAAAGFCFIDKKAHRITAGCVLALAALVQTCYFVIDYDDSAKFYDKYSVSSLSIVSGEYLPMGAGMHDCNRYYPEGGAVEVFEYERGRASGDLLISNNSDKEELFGVTLLHYLGYEARDAETNERLELIRGEGGMLTLVVPAHYEGYVELRYVGRPLWRVAEAVSLLSLAGLIIWYNKERKKDRATEGKLKNA